MMRTEAKRYSNPGAFFAPKPIAGRWPTRRASEALAVDGVGDASRVSANWLGRSGRLYRCGIERLHHCRAPARAAYLLVARDSAGRASALFAGLAISRAPTVNLARIRRRAVQLGASEVHLIDLTHSASSYAARRLVRDVRAGIARAE
jgi:hypothetical protein